jgi:hypothetical protein
LFPTWAAIVIQHSEGSNNVILVLWVSQEKELEILYLALLFHFFSLGFRMQIFVVIEGLIILALARGIETLHKHLDSLRTYLSSFEKNDKVDES